MDRPADLSKITIRTDLRSGDIGYLIYLHGELYHREYGYGLSFEKYVAEGLAEFLDQYDPRNNRVWVCEYDRKMIGFMLMMKRGEAAQLRYFLIHPDFRGLGLGSKLMNLFLNFLKECSYSSAYLWTTREQELARSLYRKHGFVMTQEKESETFGKPVVEQRYDLVV